MANGFGSFYVGGSGLQSAQNALNVVANNLSNVDTKGYVRQQVIYSDKNYINLKNPSLKTNLQQSGLGVSIGDVVHARDLFLDKAFRQEKGREAFYDTCYEVVSQVEDLFQELDGEELKKAVEDMRTAFQQLAVAPDDSVRQNLVIQQSETLLGRFEALYDDLKGYQININNQIKEQVNTINDLGQQIYDLNIYIQKVELGSQETAMTARDQRDRLLDELSGMVNITYKEDNTGFVTVEIEGTEFIVDARANSIGLKEDHTTGFYTPYWNHLSDEDKGSYTYVFSNLLDISTDNNTDIGSLKALMVQRGDAYGTYRDMENPERYAKVEDNTLMESEAQLDQMMHEMITRINDLLCPNVNIGEYADVSTLLGGNDSVELTALDGSKITLSADSKVLDTQNCTVGIDGALPPQELFVRVGCERYTAVSVPNNNGGTSTVYVYNEEDYYDPSKCYEIGSTGINPKLKEQESLLPVLYNDGEYKRVDYDMGAKLAELFDAQLLTITPNDNTPGTFEEYYNRLIGDLGTTGNVYKSSNETLTTTVASLDNQRQQVMGVSSDEELTHMVKYQSAYNAASRFITVISQMTELIVTGLI